MRILVGTFDTGLIHDFASGFRALGHTVTTVGYRPSRFTGPVKYDVDLSPGAKSIINWPNWVANSTSYVVRIPRGTLNRLADAMRLALLLSKHDVFFFQCGGISLTQGNKEYWLLRGLGKRVVAAFMGGEARDIRVYKQQYGESSVTPELEEDCDRRTGHDAWTQLRAVRMAELYADVLLSQPNQAGLAIRPYSHLFIPIVVSDYACTVPGRDIPVVVHAPSSRATKGTNEILQAIDRLKREGVRLDFRLLENCPNADVRRELVSADVLIDQLFFGYHGKLALEGLASGCAVASSNDEVNEPFPKGRPIWHIARENLVDQLRILLQSKELRLSLAYAGRDYVERYHDHVEVAKRILDRLSEGNDSHCEHKPRFFAEWYRPLTSREPPMDVQKLNLRAFNRFGMPSDARMRELSKFGQIPRGSQI